MSIKRLKVLHPPKVGSRKIQAWFHSSEIKRLHKYISREAFELTLRNMPSFAGLFCFLLQSGRSVYLSSKQNA